MTPFTDIGAAIEEAAWLAYVHKKPHSVYQLTADTMVVDVAGKFTNAMFTTGTPGTATTEHRCAA